MIRKGRNPHMTHFYSAASHTKKAYKELLFKIAALSMSCLMTLLLLTGCSAKHPITPEEFTSIAEEQGYSVQDVTESTTSTYNVESYLSASNNSAVFCHYVQFGDTQSAMEFYNSVKSEFGDSITSNIDSSAYNKCTAYAEDGFQILVRLEKTVVFSLGGAAYESQGEEMLKALGYN